MFKVIGYCRKIAAMKIVAEHGMYRIAQKSRQTLLKAFLDGLQ